MHSAVISPDDARYAMKIPQGIQNTNSPTAWIMGNIVMIGIFKNDTKSQDNSELDQEFQCQRKIQLQELKKMEKEVNSNLLRP
mmetsp:Transcript_8245/g.11122  ORF Transcript_8245/g.11122 Transcript_8245/m.11122 type:complete len:83 (-) Transcript_8245:100-348(-)